MRTFQQLNEAVFELQYEHKRRSELFAQFTRAAPQAIGALVERGVALETSEILGDGTIILKHLGTRLQVRFRADLKSERFRVGLEDLAHVSNTDERPLIAAVYVDRQGNIFESAQGGESNAGISSGTDVARTITHLLLAATAG